MTTTKKKYNIVFWGTPELCIPYLKKLNQETYNLVALVTNPDRPVGRKQVLTPSAVKVWGEKHNIPVLTPERLDEFFFNELKGFAPDLSVVVAYGKIIPETIINLPAFGTLNVHYSLLPRWRGASPVESAILSGDSETGVSIQQMVFELDAGDVISEQKLTLEGNEFTHQLKNTLSTMGAKLLEQTLPKVFQHDIVSTPQDPNKITKCGIIQKAHGEIHLFENSITLWRKYRAYAPWPGIFYFDSTGKRIKITEAIFEKGEFKILKIIPEGKKEISWEEYTT